MWTLDFMGHGADYLVGPGVTIGLIATWIAVQNAWRRVFPDAVDDPDVLAERRGCDNCGCLEYCERRRARSPGPSTEEDR